MLSLLLVIVAYPVLDHGDRRRLVLGGLMFAPVLVSTVRLSRTKGWLWPAVLLMLAAVTFAVANTIIPSRALAGMEWGVLTAFFGLTVAGLFSYLKSATYVGGAQLYTAVSIYLVLGMLWFSLYSAIDAVDPGAIRLGSSTATGRPSELLYFSLVTLSTIGYGDVVPLQSEVRILAALEGVTGVLYVAIAVALLVNAYRQQSK